MQGQHRDPLLSVQITTFSSGGIAVAVCLSHKIADAHSAFAFTAAWATAASHEDQPPRLPLPAFDAASLYPPILQKRDLTLNLPSKNPTNLVTKRFTFGESTIASLKNSSPVTDLTRVQATVAFLWRCCMRARENETKSRPSIAGITVNMRGKATPPLPDNLFGNLVYQVVATMTVAEAESKSRFEEKVSSVIKKIDGEGLREYREDHGWPLMNDAMKEATNEVGCDWDMYMFSSWTRFGFQETDFGWGRPVWMGMGTGNVMVAKNIISLTDRRGYGDGPGGMDAWVTMEGEDMIRFERDEEIVAYASSSA